jgi:hypothetical protein
VSLVLLLAAVLALGILCAVLAAMNAEEIEPEDTDWRHDVPEGWRASR